MPRAEEKSGSSSSKDGKTNRGLLSASTTFGFLLLLSSSLVQAGAFQNLDFEQAKVVIEPDRWFTEIATTNALPGWSAVKWDLADFVEYNVRHRHVACISINDTNVASYFGIPILQGRYSVFLSTQSDFGTIDLWPSIAQVGTLPSSAKSIRFLTDRPSGDGIGLIFAGNFINLTYLGGTGQPFYVYGGDIARFAGQTGQLMLISMGRDGAVLDDIVISDAPLTPIRPALDISVNTNGVCLSWPLSSAPFVVEQSVGFSSAEWEVVTNVPSLFEGRCHVVLPQPTNRVFYRLSVR